MDLSGLSAFGGAIYPGFVAGQEKQAQVDTAREAATQARLRTQEALDERLALTALGNAFGVSAPIPPTAAPPMAPGVASQPAAATAMPPGNAPPPVPAPPAGPPAPGQVVPQPAAAPPVGSAPAAPGVGPSPAAAPMARPAAPAPAGPTGTPSAPPGGGMAPRPAPSLGGMQGQMTTEQLAQRILAANPGLKNRPDLLVRAMAKGQALLAPDAKAELVALQVQQKIDAANQKFELGQLSLQNKVDLLNQANSMKLEIEKLKQSGANERQTSKLEATLDMLTKKLEADQKKTETVVEGKKEVEKIKAGFKSRSDMVKMATKAGVKVDPSWDNDELQRQTAEGMDKQNSKGVLSDDDAASLAQLGMKDPSVFNHLGYGQAGNQNRQKVWNSVFTMLRQQGKTPEEIAAARVAITGELQQARTAGAQAGSVRLGTKEIDEFGPLVIAGSEKVKRTDYPTVNRIIEAVQRGQGGTEIVTLSNNIQALKNAYAQVMIRGGKPSDSARKLAAELIDEAWSKGQIKAAVAAMRQEAILAGIAAKRAGEEISAETAGRAPATPSGGAASTPDSDDPLGLK